MKLCLETDGLEKELEQVEALLNDLARDPLGREPLSSIIATVTAQKGKRLRPLLILLTGRLGPEYPGCRDQLCRLAAVVELTHAASLIHDDVIDDSPLRRGKPTVQARFGKDMAVYAGDFLLSKILHHLMEHEMVRSGLILARSMSEMCCGEITQYEAQFDTETTEEKYFTSILGKTAAMFAASCQLGGVESGCGEETVHTLRRFGRDLGVLFQLRDDLLDYTSSEQAEGKPVHSDFKHGIYTLPVLHAFRCPDTGAELKDLALRVQNGDHDGALCRRMEALVDRAGGVAYARSVMGRYEQRALDLLSDLPESPVTAVLEALTRSLISN